MTVLAQLQLDESAELDFGLEISGAEDKVVNVRFIIEGPDYGIVCNCVEKDGIITASIPKLSGILESGIYSSRLEVIVDGKHFQPLVESIELSKPVSISTTRVVSVKPKNPINMEAKDVSLRISKPEVVVHRAEPVQKKPEINDPGRLDKINEVYSRIREFEDKLKTMKSKK